MEKDNEKDRASQNSSKWMDTKNLPDQQSIQTQICHGRNQYIKENIYLIIRV